MSMDLTGITNKNEYYTNHYFSTVFEENTRATISGWNAAARESEEIKTPWSLLRQNARQYYTAHDKFVRSSVNLQVLANIKALVGNYLKSLGYPEAKPEVVAVDDSLSVPVYLEMTKSNGAPLLWVLLSASKESDAGIMESFVFNANDVDDDAAGTLYKGVLGEIANEDLVTKILFGTAEPPRFVMLIGMNQIALIDRNKWNEKRYLQFELEEIFSRLENTTLQAMSVLLHKDSLCPDDGKVLLDELDEQSQKNASGVSQDLKYALRESIELLGNEVLYDMKARLGRDLDADPVDAGQLTLECLRYMYRMLFVLFIESRPELGYAPIKAQSYYSGYSLESLRDIADNIRDDVNEVGDGYYLHETLAKLYELIYDGYPKTEDELKKATGSDSLHDMFLIAPLKAHIFDPEYTKMITAAKLRNSCMLRIIDLMSLTRATGRKNGRRGRISYVNLGINQMGAVYEALLSYRGFIAEHDLYILMTNYKMLDYLLVRPKDALLWQDNNSETLKYIAVDELHTFDGAQGTDLACLLRRLKRRLGIYDGYLCCVGTSATMGSKENNSNILNYAEEIFGEPFDKDAIITEDRLSAQEFFAGAEVTEFTLPTVEQAIELEKLSEEDEPSAYLQSAVKDWLPNFSFNVLDAEGRIQLGYELMHHSFMQSVINLTGGTYYQVSKIAEDLAVHYPDLKTLPDADVVINSLFALISHARTGKVGKLRPFLNVQVQLWMRELRRLVAKVDSDEITYEIAHDLNKQQAKQYLPVVNCRDCGITGWVSVLNERSNATMTNIESFYNLYFRADEKIVMMFPHSHDERVSGMIPARICPDCLQVKLGEDGTDECVNCGAEMVDVMIPSPIKTSGTKNHKQYVCPCCGSRRGLSLMGLRSATEISASISQMFASKFNDDKKTLAFSDNVQDAAHRAGFFNSRTWRFGLRTAIQKYCTEIGSGKNLADFQNGFIKYWHEHMTDEQFVRAWNLSMYLLQL